MTNTNNDIITFGCRLNTFESEVMKKHAKTANFSNYILINSCSVTGEAERQARQEIRKQRKLHPESIIILAGCSAQTSPDYFGEMPELDFAFGNNEKLQLSTWKQAKEELSKPREEQKRVFVGDINDEKYIMNDEDIFGNNLEEVIVSDFSKHTKGFVQIQRGCRNRCSYCLIALIRGKNHSYTKENILKQCKALTEKGYKEIALTGVDIASYGSDFKDNKYSQMSANHLADLVESILEVIPSNTRIRLSSLDPALNYDKLIELAKKDNRLVPFWHLSLQNGDNDILQKMRRRHTREQVISLCKKLKEELGEKVMIGADIITGFPTETDENFTNTLNLVKECGIQNLHVFPYSERKGTFAQKQWKDEIQKKVKKDRAKQLRDLGDEILKEFIVSQTGKEIEVLIESDGNTGWSENYIHCKIANKTFPENTLVKGKIISFKNGYAEIQA
ncbi:MAG: tRNA (N(6)-L-threonylcarbamoyladenosine(37)-C(2))-methylthiotransferase MtaB [Alphaproteobacteria bacterium]|nr:tRNA (N(6)-L-threonylcarbamoyladenosine(37)-C(2))-methylthiotransferase MtaB [Alphaproteobacteria bacterium]